jgi:uncharacterized protein (TIGR03086 family)
VSEFEDSYRTNAAILTEQIEAVEPSQWLNPSPCAGWDTRDVVRHCVDLNAWALGWVDLQLSPAPAVTDDPGAAWRSSRDDVLGALADENIAGTEVTQPFGTMPFDRAVAMFVGTDFGLHAWDVAQACDREFTIDNAAEMLEGLLPMDEALRHPEAFGPKVDPPQADDPQTRLLNFLGRRV